MTLDLTRQIKDLFSFATNLETGAAFQPGP